MEIWIYPFDVLFVWTKLEILIFSFSPEKIDTEQLNVLASVFYMLISKYLNTCTHNIVSHVAYDWGITLEPIRNQDLKHRVLNQVSWGRKLDQISWFLPCHACSGQNGATRHCRCYVIYLESNVLHRKSMTWVLDC